MEYARRFAAEGMDLVLISRTKEKLEKVKTELKSQYRVKVLAIAADFTQTDIYDRIEKELHGLDIGILVNNVGMNQSHSGLYLSVPNRWVIGEW